MADRDDKREGAEIDPDAPPSAEEALASSRLREGLEGRTPPGGIGPEDPLALVGALRAAWSPEPIAADDHAQIVDELPTNEELRLAAELAAELEASTPGRSANDLVTALRAAWSPPALDPEEHRAIVARIVGASAKGTVVPFIPKAGRVTRLVMVTTTTALALAASVVVWITTNPGPAEAPLALARARSTQPLFAEPFRAGETSARIDKIAIARAADYRDNRFAKWGVR
jgi:hypothetical protein